MAERPEAERPEAGRPGAGRAAPESAGQEGSREQRASPLAVTPGDPLVPYRRVSRSAGDRVRWACTLEAVAPKLGNVHPSASFADLNAADFLTAGAQLAWAVETHPDWPVGRIIFDAVRRCRDATGTNVNLGIALLVVPLVKAERLTQESDLPVREAVRHVLEGLTPEDGQHAFAAIRLAQPGGLGRVERMDVAESGPVDLRAAMADAADRDLIALQYATAYAMLFDSVVPVVQQAVRDAGDVLTGIREAQLRLLAATSDSLIARKCGREAADEARAMAVQVLRSANCSERVAAEAKFDAWLRSDGHRRNPGATADLIAAALYLLLGNSRRCNEHSE